MYFGSQDTNVPDAGFVARSVGVIEGVVRVVRVEDAQILSHIVKRLKENSFKMLNVTRYPNHSNNFQFLPTAHVLQLL